MLLYVNRVNYNVNSNYTKYLAQLCGRIFTFWKISTANCESCGAPTDITTNRLVTCVEIGTGGIGGNNWCGTSVEFCWTGRSRVEWGVGTKCLWSVVKVGCAMKGRGRFVRDVCGN